MFPGIGMGGVNPQQMAEMQKISQHISSEIRIDYAAKSVTISMFSAYPEAQALIPQLLDQFSGVLAQQLSAFFAIRGEIVEVGKPK